MKGNLRHDRSLRANPETAHGVYHGSDGCPTWSLAASSRPATQGDAIQAALRQQRPGVKSRKRRLLSAGQAADYLGMTRKQFRRFQDEIPQAMPRRAGASGSLGWRRYWQHDLDRWLDQQRREPVGADEQRSPARNVTGPIGLDDCPELD